MSNVSTFSSPAYGALSPTTPLAPLTVERRDPLPKDVQIEILYCGVCHSDLHTVRNEWGGTIYPCVPGHEIIGRVTRIGKDVRRFKEGDYVAVGCMVDSCRSCQACQEGEEHFCENRATLTYGSKDPHLEGVTYGGYSSHVVVTEDFVMRVPDGVDLAANAPLVCAGITTYSPLRHWGVGKGHKVGIVGLGGLGHMGVKFANAFGAHVVLFTTSPGKTEDAKRLGAHEVVVSKNLDEMEKHAGSFDFILDTVSAQHDLNAYLELLKRDATLTQVGLPVEPQPISAFSLMRRRRRLSGSFIGSIKETQEMLDFCADNGIACDIEMIRIDQINEAYERMIRSDVKYRFVIDIKSLKSTQ